MQFMVLRRSDEFTEAGQADHRLDEQFMPAAQGVWLSIDAGGVNRIDTPADPRRTIAGFALIEAPSKQDAIAAWSERRPAVGGEYGGKFSGEDGGEYGGVYELREGGCPGGCAPVMPAQQAAPAGTRYAVLLRSTEELDSEAPVPQHQLDALDQHNAREAAAGVLLGASGLRASARGARISVARNTFSVVDGPFTELKELIAGYWLIRVASLKEAIAWASRNPYPTGPRVTVEIRALRGPDCAT